MKPSQDSNEQRYEPDDEPIRLTPEPRARERKESPPVRIEGDPGRLRERMANTKEPREPKPEEVVRLQPERMTGLMPEQTVTYADLVHDEKKKVRAPGEFLDWGSGRRLSSMRWLYVSASVVALLLVGAMYWMLALARQAPKVNPIGMPKLTIEPRVEEPREEHIANLLGSADAARELFGVYLRCATAAELEPLLRRDPGVMLLVERHHRLANLPRGWKVPDDSKWEVHTDHDPVYGVLSGYFPDDAPFAVFMTLEEGKLAIDWKSTSAYSTASFAKLAAGQGSGEEIRTWIEPAVYYSAGYPESEYKAYRLYGTLDDPPVWGYAKLDGEVGRQLADTFKKRLIVESGSKPKPRRYLVQLQRTSAGALPNQWEISRLLHDGWLVPWQAPDHMDR